LKAANTDDGVHEAHREQGRPGWGNRKGDFAPFNPKLCPPTVGTPDVNRRPA